MKWDTGLGRKVMPDMTDINNPIPGFYKTKLNGKGVDVPARIYIIPGDRDEFGELTSDDIWRCEVDGEERDPWDQWTWLMGNSLDDDPVKAEAKYNYMRASSDWDRENDPDSPFANPKKAIDISKTKSLF